MGGPHSVPPGPIWLGGFRIAGSARNGGVIAAAEGGVETDDGCEDDSGAEHEVPAVHGDGSSTGSRATSTPVELPGV